MEFISSLKLFPFVANDSKKRQQARAKTTALCRFGPDAETSINIVAKPLETRGSTTRTTSALHETIRHQLQYQLHLFSPQLAQHHAAHAFPRPHPLPPDPAPANAPTDLDIALNVVRSCAARRRLCGCARECYPHWQRPCQILQPRFRP